MTVVLARLGRPQGKSESGSDLIIAGVVLIVAALFRWAVFAGFFGSDEVTYLGAAKGVLSGEWPHSSYIGSLRYGVNVPVAAFLALFGVNEWGAVAWGFFASLAELWLVYLIATRVWSSRVGLWAMLLLAVMPLHAHFATRLMADSPLALFLSLGVWFLVRAESGSGRLVDYFWAGLAFGACYWIKDAGLYVAGMMLMAYALLCQRFHWRWGWLVLGVLLMLLGNMALMAWVHGDPLHLVHSGRNSLGRIVETSGPWFYLKALFVDIRHVGLAGWLCLLGLVQMLRGRTVAASSLLGQRLIVIWGLGFTLILSALPIKQSNYILMFAAPLALLGGLLLASLSRRVSASICGMAVVVGGLLAALQQASLHSFTANSLAAVRLADANPDMRIYVPTGAFRADLYAQALNQTNPRRQPLLELAQLDRDLLGGGGSAAWVMRDPQTEGWGDARDHNWSERSKCLSRLALHVEPQPGLGLGRLVSAAMLAISHHLPAMAGERIRQQLGVKPAFWYRVIPGCRPS